MPTSVTDVRLEAVSDADWPRIRAWLDDPGVIEWWGPPSQTEGAVIAAMRHKGSLVRMIHVDGAPVGYAHAVDATIWGAMLPDDLPTGTYDIDLFIGEPAARGLGVGVEALVLLRQEVFASTLAVAVSVFPPVSNERAVRAYEKAGFAWQSIWNDPRTGPSWFMIAGRES